jgi:hypothetical protein
MGPPKKRPRKTAYSEIQRRWDHFEYRWDQNANSFYLFNPYTGETVMSTNVAVINRAQSLWAPIEKYPSDKAQTLQVFPEWYLSRRWGRRKFEKPFPSRDTAVRHIQTVARGFLVRLQLRKYFRERYCKMLDNFSGYYYYVDKLNPDAETVWFKPRLAFPDDIQEPIIEDPDDYLKGNRYSKSDYQYGPFLKVAGLSKYDAGRAELTAFQIPNPIREIALNRYEQINLSDYNLGDLVAWMESDKQTMLKLNEYHFMRSAICKNNWRQVIDYMKYYENNMLIQLFGYYAFAKAVVPMESAELIDFVSVSFSSEWRDYFPFSSFRNQGKLWTWR